MKAESDERVKALMAALQREKEEHETLKRKYGEMADPGGTQRV